jgi:hypothetical protein
MVSMTAWMRREAPAGPGLPSAAVTVGSMPPNPLDAAASCPSAVVARAIAVAASSACWTWPPSGGEAYATGAGDGGGAALTGGAAYTTSGGEAGAEGSGTGAGAGVGAAACRSATAARAASMSLRISSCICGVCAADGAATWVGGAAAAAGRSELNGTTTTWRTTLGSALPGPAMSGSLTTGIMLSDPAGMKRDFTGSNRSWLTCTP